MTIKILVAYASKYGATAEIAEKIGELLRLEDLQVDVLSVKRVDNPSQYQAFIIGSAAYVGQWRKEASNFLKNNEKLISERPLWLFASGPTGEGDPVELTKGWRFPEKLRPIIDNIQARDIAVFHGKVDMNKLNFLEKYMLRTVKAAVGDFRDWDAVASWTKTIAAELKKLDKQ